MCLTASDIECVYLWLGHAQHFKLNINYTYTGHQTQDTRLSLRYWWQQWCSLSPLVSWSLEWVKSYFTPHVINHYKIRIKQLHKYSSPPTHLLNILSKMILCAAKEIYSNINGHNSRWSKDVGWSYCSGWISIIDFKVKSRVPVCVAETNPP